MSVDMNSALKSFVADLERPLHPQGKLMVAIREEVETALSASDVESQTRADLLDTVNTAISDRYDLMNVRTKRPGKLPSWVASGNDTAIIEALTAAVFDATVEVMEITLDT